MIDIIVGTISAVTLGWLLYWVSRPAARHWFEFPKYKMLEDEKRFSGLGEESDRSQASRPGS
jgi:membrane-associated phospholipid phosphatase